MHVLVGISKYAVLVGYVLSCVLVISLYIYIVGREMLPPALDTYLLVPLWLTSISVSILKYEGTVLFGVRIIVGKDI